MKHSREEIINALAIIKDECGDARACETCPLYRDRDAQCVFVEWSPADITLNEPDDNEWRAIK